MQSVPTTPIIDGEPAFGTYAGCCVDTSLALSERGVSQLRSAVSEKHWQWFGAFDDRLALGGAIVDAGLLGTVFLWIFDRKQGEFLVDGEVLVPGPLVTVSNRATDGEIARVGLPGCQLEIERNGGALTVNGQFTEVSLSLRFESCGQPITAICPVADREGGVNVTQKETGMRVTGGVEIDGWFDIAGTGMTDYTHGLLARETDWRWAIGNCSTDTGRSVCFNLAEFNEGLENAIWIDGEPRAVGDATFEVAPPGSDDDWHVRTECGTVALSLSVAAYRTQHLDIGLFSSAYRQPLGWWSGTVAGDEVEGPGVAETHLARW